MTNEAAERLIDALANGTADREGGILIALLDEALAAEHRATVELASYAVREAMRDHFRNMSVVIRSTHCDGNCEDGVLVRVHAILDAEAQR